MRTVRWDEGMRVDFWKIEDTNDVSGGISQRAFVSPHCAGGNGDTDISNNIF